MCMLRYKNIRNCCDDTLNLQNDLFNSKYLSWYIGFKLLLTEILYYMLLKWPRHNVYLTTNLTLSCSYPLDLLLLFYNFTSLSKNYSEKQNSCSKDFEQTWHLKLEAKRMKIFDQVVKIQGTHPLSPPFLHIPFPLFPHPHPPSHISEIQRPVKLFAITW